MRKIPEIYGKFWANYAYVFALTLFFFFFVPVFRPFEMMDFLDMGRGLYFFNIIMMMCIIFVILVIIRLTFFLTFKYIRPNWWGYSGICIFEMVTIAYFFGLYLYLMDHKSGHYMYYVAVSLQYSFLILMIPSIAHLLICMVLSKVEKPEVQNSSIVRFTDRNKQVKFAVAKESILYINAEENYIRIHYSDESGVKDYLLRSSMTAIASLAAKHGLCRCHRSYYVNPSHIKSFIKDRSDQISIELGATGIKIPVSRMYYPDISKHI